MADYVTPEQAVRKLVAAVMTRAVDDFLFGHVVYRAASRKKKKADISLETQLSALEFLTSEDYQVWGDVLGGEYDVNEILKQPERIRKVLLERLHYRSNDE